MKTCLSSIKLFLILFFLIVLNAYSIKSFGQSQEAQQLLLNVEKLTQFKNILADMKSGYQILSNGYTAVKNVSQGNFSLHEVFIDGLMLVSPEVRKYGRIIDIIKYQTLIVKEYKTAFANFQSSGNFNQNELTYLNNVYQKLLGGSLDNLDQLTNIITASILRMSDDERLKAIDEIYIDTEDKLMFLRNFNRNTNLLSLQRTDSKKKLEILQKIYEQ